MKNQSEGSTHNRVRDDEGKPERTLKVEKDNKLSNERPRRVSVQLPVGSLRLVL
jgi:hypothetical protein